MISHIIPLFAQSTDSLCLSALPIIFFRTRCFIRFRLCVFVKLIVILSFAVTLLQIISQQPLYQLYGKYIHPYIGYLFLYMVPVHGKNESYSRRAPTIQGLPLPVRFADYVLFL